MLRNRFAVGWFFLSKKKRRTVAPMPLPEAIPVEEAEVAAVLAEVRRELFQQRQQLLEEDEYQNNPIQEERDERQESNEIDSTDDVATEHLQQQHEPSQQSQATVASPRGMISHGRQEDVSVTAPVLTATVTTASVRVATTTSSSVSTIATVTTLQSQNAPMIIPDADNSTEPAMAHVIILD